MQQSAVRPMCVVYCIYIYFAANEPIKSGDEIYIGARARRRSWWWWWWWWWWCRADVAVVWRRFGGSLGCRSQREPHAERDYQKICEKWIFFDKYFMFGGKFGSRVSMYYFVAYSGGIYIACESCLCVCCSLSIR